MESESIVERVARAIVQADEQNGGPPWDMHASNKHVMERRMDRARAAISAMREPTEEMVKAGEDELNWVGAPADQKAVAAFHAMIDAALK